MIYFQKKDGNLRLPSHTLVLGLDKRLLYLTKQLAGWKCCAYFPFLQMELPELLFQQWLVNHRDPNNVRG